MRYTQLSLLYEINSFKHGLHNHLQMRVGWKHGARFIQADVSRFLALAKKAVSKMTSIDYYQYRESVSGINGGLGQIPIAPSKLVEAFMERHKLAVRTPTTDKLKLTDEELADCKLFVKAILCAMVGCDPEQLLGADETGTSPRIVGQPVVVEQDGEEVLDMGALREGNQVTYLPLHNGYGNIVAEAYMRKETASKKWFDAEIMCCEKHVPLAAEKEMSEDKIPPIRDLAYSPQVPTHYLTHVDPHAVEVKNGAVRNNRGDRMDDDEDEEADRELEVNDSLGSENLRVGHNPTPPQGRTLAQNAPARGRPRKHQPNLRAAVVQIPGSQQGGNMNDGEIEAKQQQQQLQNITQATPDMIRGQQEEIKTRLNSYSDIPSFRAACNHVRGVIGRRLLKFVCWSKSEIGSGDYSTSLVLQERAEWLASYVLFIAADQFDTLIQDILAPHMKATDEEQLQLGLMQQNSSTPHRLILAKKREVEAMRLAERRAVQREMSEEKWITIIDKVVARVGVRKMLEREGERFGEEMKAHIEETYSSSNSQAFIDKLDG